MPYSFAQFDEQIKKTKEWFTRELGSIRASRAAPQLVENIKIDYYGTSIPLRHIAVINILDAKTILIQPWDKQTIRAIEKAIGDSSIGARPIVDKDIIRIILPDLTGERREQLVKIVKEKHEEARRAARGVRTDVWNDIQAKELNKEIDEDEKFRLKEELQKKLDAALKEIAEVAERKIKEIEG